MCAIAPSLFEQAHSELLPQLMTGADFLAAHGRHLDTATTVQPDGRCATAQPACFPLCSLQRPTAACRFLVGALRQVVQHTALTDMQPM